MHYSKDTAEIDRQLRELFGGPYNKTYIPNSDAIRHQMEVRGNMLRGTPYGPKALEQLSTVPEHVIRRAYRGDPGREVSTKGLFLISLALEVPFYTLVTNLPPAAVERMQQLESDSTPETTADNDTPTAIDWEAVRTVVDELQQVRTILQPRSPQTIESFWVAPTLLTPANQHTGVCIQEWIRPGILTVIEAQAGQGKSILLRRLAADALSELELAPIFCELHRLKRRSLRELMTEVLERYGIHWNSSEAFNPEIGSRWLLQLDAFDEIPPDRRQAFLDEMATIRQQIPELPILVTSRPDERIADFPHVNVYRIRDLRPADLPPIIGKLAGPDDAAPILAALANPQTQLGNAIQSPLLAALLVLRFQQGWTVPATAQAFYKDIFDLLSRRQNQSMDGDKREIQSGLEISQLQDVFECLCFLLLKSHGPREVMRRELCAAGRDAVRITGYSCSAEAAIDDIVQLTNLLVEEHGLYRFVHATIAEYHAAAFLSECDDRDAADFYRSFVNVSNKWRDWQNTLAFLVQLDSARLSDNLFLPEFDLVRREKLAELVERFEVFRVEIDRDGKHKLGLSRSQTFCLQHRQLQIGNAFPQPKYLEKLTPFIRLWTGNPTLTLSPNTELRLAVSQCDRNVLAQLFQQGLNQIQAEVREQYLHRLDAQHERSGKSSDFSV